MSILKQARLTFQFHITGRCNLKCKHCYREEGNVEPLTFENIKDIINQYENLLETYNKEHNINKKGHINITGGEPFIREDILKILDFIGKKNDKFTFGILSNGSFIDDKIISSLLKNKVSFVQLSIDGNEKMHDYIRQKGDFKRVFKTAKMLGKNNIRTYISFTANKENYKYLPYVAKKCRRYKITKLWTDRVVPIGCANDDLSITKENMVDYLNSLKRASGNIFTQFKKTLVASDRALQFQNGKSFIYSCSAADSLITVDEFGNVMPCRRMPIVCGNVFESSLKDVYYNNEIFIDLREKNIPKECEKCHFASFCLGGAKCQSYAVYNDFNKKDPGCNL